MARKHCFAAAVSLAAGILVLFLDPGEQYFFGDSIAVLWGRPHSWGSLLLDFTRLDGAQWFRPFSNSLPPFLLFPLWGMNFLPYHLLAMALHLGLALAVFELFRRILRDAAAAFVGAAFFAFHPIQFYATYDIAFYQEPIMAALVLAALALFHRYVKEEKTPLLAAGLLCFVLALCSKETAVVMPGLVVLVLWDRWLERRLRSTEVLAATAAVSAAFVFYYTAVMGLVFRYQPDYRPSLQLQILKNALSALLWAFGIPSGWTTQAWHFPAPVLAVLGGTLLGTCLLAVSRPRTGLWRGLAWFAGAGLPAFSTHHLLPHHLYLPLIGVAFAVAGAVAWLRALSRVRLASALSAASISTLFVAAFLAARADTLSSWVGRSAGEARAAAAFTRAAGLRLAGAEGVQVHTGVAPHLNFDWMAGKIFNLLGHDELEVLLLENLPEEAPEGFYRLAYRDHWLWNLAPRRMVSARLARNGQHASLRLKIAPERVQAGSDSYCLELPQLAGRPIDLKYRFNQRSMRVAYRFAQLDQQGRACIPVPASIPWGTVDVVGVRPAGSLAWSSVQARVVVLP